MSKVENVLIITTYISTIIVLFIFCIFITHGPISLFEREPFKTIGELQRNPVFWNFSIVCVLIWVGLMIRLTAKPFGDGEHK